MTTAVEVQRNARSALLRQGDPAHNFGDAVTLPVGNETGEQRVALLSFTKPCPPGATIVSAILTQYQKGSATGGTRTLTARRIGGPWKSSTVNWNRKPDLVGVGVDSQSRGNGGDDGRTWDIDVTTHLQTVADGADWWGWQISSDNDTPLVLFSAEAPRYTPILTVEWRERPEAPETLSPSGNRAVSTNKPLLRFDFVDVGGDETLAAVQVQIDAGNDFDSPDFDSGTVATSDPELDLTTTSYGGLSDGSSTWWRVRVQDGAGLWSLWSDPVQFQRVNKGTLTLDNPADVAEPIVEDTTPPFSWTFSGTQKAYQVIVTDPADESGDWLWTSTKITSAEDSQPPPKGVIRRDDKQYEVEIRVWDNVDRESIPGDRPYVSVSRVFTFNDDPSVDPPNHLAAAVQSPTPWVDLVWQRDDQPDKWQMWRDGELVDEVDGDVWFLGGTTYRARDYEARPRRDHEWKIRAVVNGQSSRNSPTTTARPAPKGIWLSDKDHDTNVAVWGDDSVIDAKMAEVGENYEPIGSRRPVRVRSSKRGIEGTVSGLLGQAHGSNVTGQMWRNRLLALKDEDESRLQLTWGDVSIPVRVYEISVTPANYPGVTDLVYNASFAFQQVGEPYDFKTFG